jgi:hypothetical protein
LELVSNSGDPELFIISNVVPGTTPGTVSCCVFDFPCVFDFRAGVMMAAGVMDRMALDLLAALDLFAVVLSLDTIKINVSLFLPLLSVLTVGIFVSTLANDLLVRTGVGGEDLQYSL